MATSGSGSRRRPTTKTRPTAGAKAPKAPQRSRSNVGSAANRRAAPPARASTGTEASVRGSHYHHGDLRNALLAATEQLLDEVGLEGFTLREVARRAGVSHGAPAHHFDDVRGLLSEFTAESFARLASAMAERRAAADADGIEQLIATGVAYVDFALGNRARFQLMFRSDRLDPACESLLGSGDASYGHLAACIAAIAAEDGVGATPQLLADRAALAWSIVHGFATLALDNRNFAAQTGGSRVRALALVEALLRMTRPAFTSAR